MRFIFIVFLGLALAACSFSPLYTQQDAASSLEASKTRINPIAGVIGYSMKEQLEIRLKTTDGTDKKYSLTVVIKESTVGDLGVQKTNFASRSRLILKANYTLKDLKTNKILINDETTASGSYNLTTPYSTQMAKEKMQENLGLILSDNIALRVLAYFKQGDSGES